MGNWLDYRAEISATKLAPAVLLPTDMPFEYPTTIAALKDALAERGIPIDVVRLLLTMGALRNELGKPLIFVLGAAMRGIAGGERKQHLACWYVEAERTKQLRRKAIDDVDIEAFEAWAATASIHWCNVQEERPEIVTFRDSETPLSWWRGRHVAVLGCGAIGSTVAMLLSRAGVTKLQLYDNRLVTPGVLVRQIFDRKQIGHFKAAATRFNVRYTNPALEAVAHHENLVSILRDTEKTQPLLDVDVIINATASITVGTALERRFRDWPKQHPPLVSMAIGHRADAGLATLSLASAPGVTIDLDRRAKLAFANAPNGQGFLDEFWPATIDRTRLFQPEPGCSDPTFRGSAADVVALTSMMLNVVSVWLAENMGPRALGLRVTSRAEHATLPNHLEYAWSGDCVFTEHRRGYQIRLDRRAKEAIVG